MADNLTKTSWDAGDTVAFDDVAGVKYPIGKIAFGPLDTATLVSKNDALPVGFYTDASDIDWTTTVLAASASYVGPVYDTTLVGPYVSHFVKASHTGTHVLEVSGDGTNFEVMDSDPMEAGEVRTEEHYCSARYHRTTFINDGTLQTSFKHSTICRHMGTGHEIGIKSTQNIIRGDKTHNTTAPSAEALEVIGHVAKAAAPTYAEGAVVNARVTLTGDTAVTLDGESVAVTGAFFQTTQPVSLTSLPSHDVTNAGTFAVQVTSAPVTAVTGTFWQATQPVSGTFWQATQPVSGTFYQATQPVSNAGTFATQAAATGNVAHDAPDSGNPMKIGGVARTANPTVVSALDRVDAFYDVEGRQVVQPFGPRALTTDNNVILTTTSETTLLAAAAGVFHDLLGVYCSNSSATAVLLTFRDTTAGGARFYVYVPAGGPAGFMPPAPVKQASVNTNWTVSAGAGVSSVYVFAMAVKKTG